MFKRIDRVILPVPDVRKAAAWYMREFEMRMVRDRGKEIDLQVQEGEALITFMQCEKKLPLLHLDEQGHVPCFNLYTHWEDLHRNWLTTRSIQTTEIMTTPYMNVCEMVDCFGNVVGICHEKSNSLYYTQHEGAVPPMFHRVLAIFIPVYNLEASIRWYTDVLGFTLNHHWGEGADLKVGLGETIVTMIKMDEKTHRHSLDSLQDRPYYSLQSDHIHEAYHQLAEIGVALDHCQEQGGLYSFHIRTPEGLTIRISEKEIIKIG